MNKFYILSLFAIIFLSIPNVFADESGDFVNNLKEPVDFEMSVRLINVIEVDRLNGHYSLDFWYSIASDDMDFTQIPPPDVDYTNGFVEDSTSEYLEAHYYEKRVKGVFFNKFDFRDFPFDNNDLKIQIELQRPWTIDKATLIIAPDSGIESDANIPGYILKKGDFNLNTHKYESEAEIYERFNAVFTVERSPIGSFLKIIFPVLIVLGIGYVAYMFPENYDLQAALALLPLGAVVFLQVSTLDELPSLGYLTIFDKMMVMVYALIANNVISIGRQIKIENQDNHKSSWMISQFHLKISPIIAVVLGIVLFIAV